MCYVQFLNRPTRFKSTSIKPYLWPENTYDAELDKLKATDEPDKLKALAELDDLKEPLPILKVPKELTEAIEPAIKHSQRRL